MRWLFRKKPDEITPTQRLITLVSRYADAVGRHGPDSPEARAVRQEHASVAGFLDYADALDRIKRHLGGSGMRPDDDGARAHAEPSPPGPAPIRVAFDIGGVLSKFPEVCRPIIAALLAGGIEVYVITDMHDRALMLDMLQRNGIVPPVPWTNVYSANYQRHGEACKAILLRDLAIDVLIDDFGGYVAWPWPTPAPMRLLTAPDPRRPYYAPNWQIDGNECDFGRRVYLDDERGGDDGPL